jgi:hypothetical protein
MLSGHTNMLATNKIELVLIPSAAFPRYLHISWRARMLTIEMRLPENRFRSVAFAMGNPSDGPSGQRSVRLTFSTKGPGVFWAGGAAFDLSAEEVAAVRAALEPFGLNVECESISTAHLGPRAVKESTPIVRPLGGGRGVSLASVCTGASALDLSNEIGYDG